jgi:AcrR family transcriptional regulator
MADATQPPRDRMVYSAAQLVRERGVAATGVRDVVDRAAAPRGSFQHYFPGGKDQLVPEALLWSGDFAAQWVASYVDGVRRPTPSGLFTHMVSPWKNEFSTRGFERGCPVNAAAADLAGGDSPVNAPLREALARWEEAIVVALVRMGIPMRRARRLATLMLSALEGAILLARVHRDVRPLTTVAGELGPLLDQAHQG